MLLTYGRRGAVHVVLLLVVIKLWTKWREPVLDHTQRLAAFCTGRASKVHLL